MRIDRIRLKNFAGVAEAEVRFAPTGVTIVHGPNEAGKSTLMQGINVLFDHRDDSRKEEVRNTKPVNKDVGAEVEADVQVGDCGFTYFKRFHKDKETRLTIHSPRAENLVGRDAHERVQQILAGSVDTSLWQALRITQGRNLDMPELHDQPALAQALDRAAGQAKSGEKEEALFAAVHGEYNRYYTDTGREKEDPFGQARKRGSEAAALVADLQAQLNEVEADISRFASLERTVATQRRGLATLEEAHKKAQTEWDAVSQLAAAFERAAGAHQLAAQNVASANSALQQRREMVDRVGQADLAATGAAAQHAAALTELADATDKLALASATQATARSAAAGYEADELVRKADLKFREDEFAVVLLAERLEHVREADADAATAAATIERSKITAKFRTAIREAELELKTAEGVLSVASPRLDITPLTALPITVDGVAQAYAVNAAHALTVSEPVEVVIEGVARIRVEPGTSAASLRRAVQDAAQRLSDACLKAGVTSAADAEAAWTALQEAQRTVADRDRIAKQHLRDLTRDALAQLVESTRAAVGVYAGTRQSALALPESLEEAKTLLQTAGENAASARRTAQDAETALAQVQGHHNQASQALAVKAALLGQKVADQASEAARLDGARKMAGDEALGTALAAAENSAIAALAAVNAARGRLGGRDPASVKAVLDSSAPAVERAKAQCASEEQKLIALRTRLELLGDKGLAETLAEAERAAFEARDALERLERRAGAAKLLYETLCAERDAMRKAYVAPLREGIERLGRHVFGTTLRVEVNDQLQVTARTVDGVTVALDQLSTGAREQMGLLVRLAAAGMVSADGGVPLVLDDALGSTDEARLEAMGAVLRIASRNLQAIILTCSPERYVHVGASASIGL